MTREQGALLAKARESIEAARLLASKGFHDFAVSRAYYGMFYLAELLLLGRDMAFSKHSGVIAAFGQHFAKTDVVPREYHRYLIEAESSRNVGDYDPESALSSGDADKHVQRAQEMLDYIEAHVSSPSE